MRAGMRAEASIIDLRKCGFVPTGGDLQAAGIIHQMSIQAVVEVTTREIERFEPGNLPRAPPTQNRSHRP